MSGLKFSIVDVFSVSGFTGNSVVVISDGEVSKVNELSEDDFFKIALEFYKLPVVFIQNYDPVENVLEVSDYNTEGHQYVGFADIAVAHVFVEKLEQSLEDFFIRKKSQLTPVKVLTKDGETYFKFGGFQLPKFLDDPVTRRVISNILGVGQSQILGDAWVVSCGAVFPIVEMIDIESLASASFDYEYWHKKSNDDLLANIYCFTGESRPGAELRARHFSVNDETKETSASPLGAVSVGALLSIRANLDGQFSWNVYQGIEVGRPSLLGVDTEIIDGQLVSAEIIGAGSDVANGYISLPSNSSYLKLFN